MLSFIFVHGLSGWDSYDKAYRRMPYWGMRGGDLIAWLRSQGYDCYAASVAPTGGGNHMYLQGGLIHRHDIRDFYLQLLRMISKTA